MRITLFTILIINSHMTIRLRENSSVHARAKNQVRCIVLLCYCHYLQPLLSFPGCSHVVSSGKYTRTMSLYQFIWAFGWNWLRILLQTQLSGIILVDSVLLQYITLILLVTVVLKLMYPAKLPIIC